jgi:hypothetical protein
MSSIVQLGDVPAWIGAGTGAASLYLGLRGRRQAQAVDWARQLKELSGLSDEELRRLVEDNPVIAEIVGRAWEAAAETSSHDKRRLLAKVASAAIRGDAAAAQVDELPFLLRTVIALEPSHVTLLVAILMPREGRGQFAGQKIVGSVQRDEMLARSSAPDLLDPALSVLDREGLIERSGSFLGENAKWTVNGYGLRFFAFLQETGEAEPTS